MAKKYYLTFGSSDPRTYTGLTPSFTIFCTSTGQTVAAPGITEILSGSGFYQFTNGATESIFFLADAGSGVSTSDRYLKGNLDPIQAVDEKVGTLQDSFGTDTVDPTTILGFVMRLQEFLEGDAVFTKSTGLWDVYSRGASQLLVEKSLTNTTTLATKY